MSFCRDIKAWGIHTCIDLERSRDFDEKPEPLFRVIRQGANLRWLVTKNQDYSLQLPCPAFDLLKLFSDVSPHLLEDPKDFRGVYERAMSENPAILIVGLVMFHEDHDRAPKSLNELSSYCCSDFVRKVDSIEIISSHQPPFKQTQLEQVFGLYFQASGNRQFKKALVRFGKLAGPGSALSKDMVQSLVGDLICREDFPVPEYPQPELLAQSAVRWNNYQLIPVDIKQLFGGLARQYQRNEEMRDQLRDLKLVAMKGLAYGASHEINNPLANIATRSQTLLADETDPGKRNRLAVIFEQAMRAHEMISDMMLFANPPVPRYSMANLSELTAKVVNELRPLSLAKQIRVRVFEYPDLVPIEVDCEQFQVALNAIVRNSIEAIGDHGEIRIRLFRESENQIGLSILDDGPGIPNELGENLFDPFFSGREAGRGLGFGLTKAWRIFQLHGGNIYQDPECQVGAKMEIRLPIRQADGEDQVVTARAA